MGVGGLHGVVLGERLQVAIVPRLAHDGGEGVPHSPHDLQHPRELRLQDQGPLVLHAFVQDLRLTVLVFFFYAVPDSEMRPSPLERP
jgi:hypothetical protein